MDKYIEELEAAKKAAFEAGKAAMKFYKSSDIGIDYKKGNSPVTKADLASEEVVYDHLRKFDYGFLSEESSEENERINKERVWIIDPLDGTKGFIDGLDEFSIMIGLSENGKPAVGVVYNPAREIIYFGSLANGSYKQEQGREPERLSISEVNEFNKVRLLVSRHHLLELEAELAKKLSFKDKVLGTGAGLKMCTVANGQAELYINSSDKTGEWDICAADIILSEAGGKLTNMSGNEIIYNKKNPINLDGFVASNGKIHGGIINEIGKLNK